MSRLFAWTQDHVFACLLEGFGGAEAARHLHRFAHELYRSCLGQCGQGQEEEALRATMGQLEQALGPAARTSLVNGLWRKRGIVGEVGQAVKTQDNL